MNCKFLTQHGSEVCDRTPEVTTGQCVPPLAYAACGCEAGVSCCQVCVPSLAVSMPAALRAGAFALFDWMNSYSVCGVGVGIRLLAHLGAMLGLCWPILEPCWGYVGPSCCGYVTLIALGLFLKNASIHALPSGQRVSSRTSPNVPALGRRLWAHPHPYLSGRRTIAVYRNSP